MAGYRQGVTERTDSLLDDAARFVRPSSLVVVVGLEAGDTVTRDPRDEQQRQAPVRRHGQRPWNVGLRFSRRARMPS